MLTKKIKVDAALECHQMTQGLCRRLEKLEPFGMGNPKPVFMVSGIKMGWQRRVGQDEKHLSFYVEDGKSKIKSIYFNCPNDSKFDNHTEYDIVFTMSIDSWNGEDKVNLNVVDIRETMI